MKRYPEEYYIEIVKSFLNKEIYHSQVYKTVCEQFSIIAIGSWATGSFDQYSDIDLVIAVPDKTYHSMHAKAVESGEIKSTGDLRLETYDPLEIAVKIRSLSQIDREIKNDLNVALRIYTKCQIWNDPENQFERIVKEHRNAFHCDLPQTLREKVLRLRNAVSFYEGMILRDDLFSCNMLKFQFLQNFMEACFLVDSSPYPYVKWLQYWVVRETRIGRKMCNELLHFQIQTDVDIVLTLMRRLLMRFEAACSEVGVKDLYITNAMDDPWFSEKFKWRLEKTFHD
jgi:predicted nucleotidyltransferase